LAPEPTTEVERREPASDVPPPPRRDVAPPEPPVPTAAQVVGLSHDYQRALLHHAVERLDRDLSKLKTGASWKKYFELDSLKQAIAHEGRLDSDVLQQLRAIAERLDQTGREGKYQKIADLWGFRTLRVALPEYAMEELPKAKRCVALNASELTRWLDRKSMGENWKAYLELDWLGERVREDGICPDDVAKLTTIHARFVDVEKNPAYEALTHRRPFRIVASGLGRWITMLPADLAAVSITENSKESHKILHRIEIHAVRVSDDDGTREAAITPTEVRRWVDYANTVYEPAGIQFRFFPEAFSHWSTLKSTLINNMMGEEHKDWAKARDEANRYAAKHPNKIVVFFRHGYQIQEKRFNMPCLQPKRIHVSLPSIDVEMEKDRELTLGIPDKSKATGGGFSSTGYNFIVMPGFNATRTCGRQTIALLAHELGHYLGLHHPFTRTFTSLDEAEKYVAEHPNRSDYDGDGLSDTPEDPGLYYSDMKCSPAIEVTIGGIDFTLPRDNIMSYYDNATRRLSLQQVQRIHDTLRTHQYRKLLGKGSFEYGSEHVVIGKVCNRGGTPAVGKHTATLYMYRYGRLHRELGKVEFTLLFPGETVTVFGRAPDPVVTDHASYHYSLHIDPYDDPWPENNYCQADCPLGAPTP